MFGLFKRKRPLTPQEDLRAVMTMIFDRLKAADRMTGIERDMAISITFGTTIPLIREYFPNVPIEDDSPAMAVVDMGTENPDWARIDSDIAHMLHQVRTCPRDPEMRYLVVRSFLAPRYIEKQMAAVGL